MKNIFATIVLFTAFAALAAHSVGVAYAQNASQEQELEQASRVVCTSGAYGQQTCDVTTEQRGKQKQEIVFRKEGKVLAAHKVVDTALDAKTMSMVVGLFALGVASTVGFVKTKNL